MALCFKVFKSIFKVFFKVAGPHVICNMVRPRPDIYICNLVRPRKTIYVIWPAPEIRYMEFCQCIFCLTCHCGIRGNSHELRSPMRDEISVPGLGRGPEFHAAFSAGAGDIHDGCCGVRSFARGPDFYAGFNAGPCFFVRDQELRAACKAGAGTPCGTRSPNRDSVRHHVSR